MIKCSSKLLNILWFRKNVATTINLQPLPQKQFNVNFLTSCNFSI